MDQWTYDEVDVRKNVRWVSMRSVSHCCTGNTAEKEKKNTNKEKKERNR